MEQISQEREMRKYHLIKNIRLEEDFLIINIDGNDFNFPLKIISKKLSNAHPNELNNYIISPSGYGIHWPSIDEDISIDGLLKIKSATKTHRGKSLTLK